MIKHLGEFCYFMSYSFLRRDNLFFPIRSSINKFISGKLTSNASVCQLFNDYVAQLIKIYYYRNKLNFHLQDCHHIPQWYYAQQSTYLVPYKDLRKPSFMSFLSSFFHINITYNTTLSNKNHSCSYPSIRKLNVTTCLNTTNYKRLMSHYKLDYQYLRQYF